MNDTLHIIATSDIHGALFPYDFTTLSPAPGSLARVSTYIKNLRDAHGDDNVVLLDCGDILQGGATVYLYNYIATDCPHPVARMMRYMRYDAMTIGNHDIEMGHAVYDRFTTDMRPLPVLGGNVIHETDGSPYFAPYTIIRRAGMRIAVIGLTTPAAPAWVPRSQWRGMRFKPMADCARQWFEHVRANENPDLIIGLFHSGYHSEQPVAEWFENASRIIAETVPGFDIIIMGHDHKKAIHEGSPLLINPGAHATEIAHVTIEHPHSDKRHITGVLENITDENVDEDFMKLFQPEFKATEDYASRVIGVSLGEFSSHDALHGPSAFMTLLHSIQLEITGAQISLASPPSLDAAIHRGSLRIRDMYTLYRYENQLCTVAMTGGELKNYLEMSYDRWDTFMDSAQGIDYTVDCDRDCGDRINILQLSDGTLFSPQERYTVAVNAYRAHGGGDLMTLGAGIPYAELQSRILRTSSHDLRHYLVEAISSRAAVSPHICDNWHFIPAGQ